MLIHWLMEEGLIAKERFCPMCDEGMSLAKCADRSDLFKWECRKQEKGKKQGRDFNHKKLVRENNNNNNLTLEEILKLAYCWCQLGS